MFAWKQEFELGIETIDNQHKKLLEIGNRISDLLDTHEEDSDDYDEIINVIEELKDYTVYHFQNEEKYFLEYKYPDYIKHKKEHDDFIVYISSVDFNKIDENQEKFMKDLLKKVINWVFNHIITTDFLYKDYLVLYGVR